MQVKFETQILDRTEGGEKPRKVDMGLEEIKGFGYWR